MIKLYFVGAGTPTPTPTRFGTSYVLKIDEDLLMFDCGPAATHKMVKLGLWPNDIDHLFITHHHFDHNVDYPCFISCHWDQSTGGGEKLRIWGPKPMAAFHDRLFGEKGAFVFDLEARVGNPGSQAVFKNRGGQLPRPMPAYEVNEIGPGKIVEENGWSVTASPAQHIEPFMSTFSYRVDCPQCSIVFSSDTGPCESFINLAKGADIAVIHCWDHQENMVPDLAKMITGTIDAATLAQEAGIKKLILSHQGAKLDSPGSMEHAIGKISEIFEGEFIFANELMVLDL